jgi:hypothetical protein
MRMLKKKANRTNVVTDVRQVSIVGLTLSLTLALTAACMQPIYAQCAGCEKHLGTEPGLLPRNGTTSTDPPSNSLWGGTSDTTLKTGTESTMLQTGTQSTMLQTGTESTMLQTGTQSMLLQGGAARTKEDTNIEILIDCSQSMKEKLGGMLASDEDKAPKMEMAKKVLEQTMATIPQDVNVGLRVFGQSFHNDPYLDCQQTALLVPIGQHNRRAIVERIRGMRPYGLTPLTFALEQAASDLSPFSGRKQLILISDGAETCGLDPCAMIHQLTARGINMKIDIVGLGLKNDREAKIQLDCIAKQTGGKFYDSNTAAELVDNLRKITAGTKSTIEGKVLTKMKPADVQQVLPGLGK